MIQLDFPPIKPRLQKSGGRIEIFDVVRRKYVALTPEEWVRQHVIGFLISNHKLAAGRMSVEKKLKVGHRSLRTDIVCYTAHQTPLLLVECKAFDVALTPNTYAQVAQYAGALGSQYIMLTNGLEHSYAQLHAPTQQYQPLKALPQVL